MRLLMVESGVMAPDRFVYQCYPPHGLLYLASYLRGQGRHHQMALFDMMEKRARPEDVDNVLRCFSPDLVAIHAMTFQASSMHAVAARIKRWRPSCIVAVGGPHPTAAPGLTLADKNIDVAAMSEGEETFVEIVKAAQAGNSFAGIPGAATRGDGGVVMGPTRPFIEDLDRIPFPAWDLIDLSRYFTDVMLNQNDITCRRELTTIFTSRACPFGCIFCHNMFGKKFRARSVENVLDEMEILQRRHGIRELHIIDDCFNCQIDRAAEILEGMLARGLDYRLAFPNGIRGDRLPNELLDLMVKAGVYKINVGVESGSPRIQKLIRKGLSLEAVEDGIQRASERGIFTHGFFMLGFPGETAEDMEMTIDLACRSRLHTAGFALLSPFPGTQVHKMAVEAGKEIAFDLSDTSYQRVSTNLTEVSDETLVRMHRKAHRKFYGSPRRVARILAAMPHPLDFFRVGVKHFRLKFL